MAATDPEKDNVPGVLGGDLPGKEQSAFEESHDVDIPHSESDPATRGEDKSLTKEVAVGTERVEKPDVSSNSSEDGSPTDRDLEKGKPETNTSEESKEPPDPNIVDWNGPDDPQNPLNWYGKLCISFQRLEALE
jgi:hypothetical protein